MTELSKITWGDPVKSATLCARIPQGKLAGIVVAGVAKRIKSLAVN